MLYVYLDSGGWRCLLCMIRESIVSGIVSIQITFRELCSHGVKDILS